MCRSESDLNTPKQTATNRNKTEARRNKQKHAETNRNTRQQAEAHRRQLQRAAASSRERLSASESSRGPQTPAGTRRVRQPVTEDGKERECRRDWQRVEDFRNRNSTEPNRNTQKHTETRSKKHREADTDRNATETRKKHVEAPSEAKYDHAIAKEQDRSQQKHA